VHGTNCIISLKNKLPKVAILTVKKHSKTIPVLIVFDEFIESLYSIYLFIILTQFRYNNANKKQGHEIGKKDRTSKAIT